jgi:hypothetical protein
MSYYQPHVMQNRRAPPPAPIADAQPQNNAPPAAAAPPVSKMKLKALSKWNEIAKSMGYNKMVKDPVTGKWKMTNVARKGTPAYAAVQAEWVKVKARGY